MNLEPHAIKTADLEQQLARLEQQSKVRDGTSDEPAAASDRDDGSGAVSRKAEAVGWSLWEVLMAGGRTSAGFR
jgi:hypothetical protein